MLDVVSGETAQYGFWIGGALLERGRIFDHLVVLLDDQFPIDRTCQYGFQIRVIAGFIVTRTIEFLAGNGLEAWQQIEPKQVREGKGDLTLAMTIDILSVNLHVRAVAQNAFNHGCHLRRGTALELGVDAGRFLFHMPVDHDATATIANVPFGHQVLIPGAKFLGIRCTGCCAFSPYRGITSSKNRVRASEKIDYPNFVIGLIVTNHDSRSGFLSNRFSNSRMASLLRDTPAL